MDSGWITDQVQAGEAVSISGRALKTGVIQLRCTSASCLTCYRLDIGLKKWSFRDGQNSLERPREFRDGRPLRYNLLASDEEKVLGKLEKPGTQQVSPVGPGLRG